MRILITGANRGIGLEFVKQYLSRGDDVDAVVRNLARAADLKALQTSHSDHLRLFECDVAQDSAVHELAKQRGVHPLDVLINNAGVMGKMTSLEHLDTSDVLETFNINAVGALRITRALTPALELGKARKVVHISSTMGSIGDNRSGGAYAYRMSKAALNMASKCAAFELAQKNIVSVVFNPGWVQTDMGGSGAPTPVEESVSKMIALIERLTPQMSGGFWDYRGTSIEW